MISLKDYIIMEMLKSSTTNQIISQINKKFSKYGKIKAPTKRSSKYTEKGVAYLKVPKEIYTKEFNEFENLLKIHNWHISFIEVYDLWGFGSNVKGTESMYLDKIKEDNLYKYKVDNKEYIGLAIEPEKSSEKTNYIYKDCGGIVYHITKLEYLDSILNKGLRLKSGETNKNYAPRIYVLAEKTEKEAIKGIDILAQTLKNYWLNKKDSVVIKINLNKLNHKCNFYADTIYRGLKGIDLFDNCFYTDEMFPANILEFYNLKDICNEHKFTKLTDEEINKLSAKFKKHYKDNGNYDYNEYYERTKD